MSDAVKVLARSLTHVSCRYFAVIPEDTTLQSRILSIQANSQHWKIYLSCSRKILPCSWKQKQSSILSSTNSSREKQLMLLLERAIQNTVNKTEKHRKMNEICSCLIPLLFRGGVGWKTWGLNLMHRDIWSSQWKQKNWH